MCKSNPKGFTLIELMITVAVIGILAAVAYPSYTEYVRKARRADAQAFLSDLVARQQHYLLDRRSYATSIANAPSAGGLGIATPNGVDPYYTVSVNTNNNAPPTFTITATPKGSQVGEKCGALTITNAGIKAAAIANCW